jgi:hypothetical protein
MAAVSVSAQNTRLTDAEATTEFGDIGGGAGGALETDFKYQNANCYARKGASGSRGIYFSDSVNTDISGTGTYQTIMVKYICTTPGLLSSLATPGIRLEVGSGSTTTTYSSNFHYYDVQGNDTYPIDKSWLVVPIDPNIASHRTGTTGSPSLTAFDTLGMRYDQTGVSKSPNEGLDAVDVGAGLTLTGGDGADADGTWQDFSDADWGTAANRYGYVRESEGVFLIYGMMVIGSATDTVFTDSNQTIVYPDGLFASGFSGYTIDYSTGNVFTETSVVHIGQGTKAGEDTRPVLGSANAGGTGTATITGNTYINFNTITFESGATVNGSTFLNSEKITQNGATIDGCVIEGATTADGVAFIESDDPSLISNCDFTFSDGHAIEITTPGTYTFTGNTFTGYGSTGTNDAAIYNNSGGAVTINVAGGVASPTYRNGASATTTVNNNISVTFDGMKDLTEVRIYTAGTSTELAGIENATAGSTDDRSFTASIAASTVVDYVLHSVLYETIRVENFTWPNSDSTIPVQQRFDRNNNNP